MAVDSIGGPDRVGSADPGAATDPDVDLRDPAQAGETRPREWDLLAAVAVGGVLGAEARYGIGELIPHHPGQFPWGTLLINASGCLLIGVLMVVLLELTSPHRLARPFLGVGILGGYTTFSTFAMDVEQLILDQKVLPALLYTVVTVLSGLAAVWAATALTRGFGQILARQPSRRRRDESYR